MTGYGPAGLWWPAKAMAVFARPLLHIPVKEEEADQLSRFVAVAWEVFSRPRPRKIRSGLEQWRTALRWHMHFRMGFDAFVDLLYRRHIYFFPQAHGTRLHGYTVPQLRRAAMFGERALSTPLRDRRLPPADPERLRRLMPWRELGAVKRRFASYTRKYPTGGSGISGAEKHRLADAYLPIAVALHSILLRTAERYVSFLRRRPQTIANHLVNMEVFLHHFIERHSGLSILLAGPRDIGDFLLHFYLQRAIVPRAAEECLIDSLSLLIDLSAVAIPSPHYPALREALEKSSPEYLDLLTRDRSRKFPSLHY